jgi:hypothetical protein
VRRLFGSKREEGVGGWRRLHNEEHHNFDTSPNIIVVVKSRIMRWEGCVAPMREMRNAYSILVGKPERKRPLGRPRHRWEDIRMVLREMSGRAWTGCIWLSVGTSGRPL